MNKQEEINNLRDRINFLREEILNCKHIWKDAKYDPETITVPDDRAGYEGHGADRWPRLSFHYEKKDRWSRECSECGHVNYTYKQEPVNLDQKPKFS